MNDVDHTKANLQEWECKCLLAEYNALREDMRMCAQFHRRDIHLLIIFIGAVLTVIYSKPDLLPCNVNVISLVSKIVPSLIFVFLLLQIISFHWENVMVRQCIIIENRVYDLFRKNLMDYESVVASRYIRKYTEPTMISAIALTTFFIVMFIFFSVRGYEKVGNRFNIAHSIELLIMIVVSAKTAYYEFFKNPPNALLKHAQSIDKNVETRKN